jgi:hypothetical protein
MGINYLLIRSQVRIYGEADIVHFKESIRLIFAVGLERREFVVFGDICLIFWGELDGASFVREKVIKEFELFLGILRRRLFGSFDGHISPGFKLVGNLDIGEGNTNHGRCNSPSVEEKDFLWIVDELVGVGFPLREIKKGISSTNEFGTLNNAGLKLRGFGRTLGHTGQFLFILLLDLDKRIMVGGDKGKSSVEPSFVDNKRKRIGDLERKRHAVYPFCVVCLSWVEGKYLF